MVTIYSEEKLFVEDLLFRFYSIFNASSQLKTFTRPKYLELFEYVATFSFNIVIIDFTIVSSIGNRTLTCLKYDSSHDKNNYRFIELCF